MAWADRVERYVQIYAPGRLAEYQAMPTILRFHFLGIGDWIGAPPSVYTPSSLDERVRLVADVMDGNTVGSPDVHAVAPQPDSA